MNVCFYSPAWPPASPPNGIATYVHHISKGLSYLGHDTFVLSGNIQDSMQKTNHVVNVEQYASGLLYRYTRLLEVFREGYGSCRYEASKISRALVALNRQQSIDVFEMEESFGWGGIVAKGFKSLAVTRLHGPHFLMMDWVNKKSISALDYRRIDMEGEAIAQADLVTAPSQAVLNKTREFYQLALNSAQVIANPIEIPSVEQRWSLPDCQRNTLLFVGRFDRIKGGDIMLDTFSKLAEVFPDLQLQFVGPDYGIPSQQGERDDIHSYMNSHLSDVARNRVSYLGYQTPEQIVKLRQRAFVTVVCSRYEAFGYNALEALSFGSPLVSCCAGGLAEIVSSADVALTVEEPDAGALAKQVERLLCDDALAQQLSQNAYNYCAANYGRNKLAGDTIAAYQTCL
jgi:glycosyltransferase involved in cell wall biosynthesis